MTKKKISQKNQSPALKELNEAVQKTTALLKKKRVEEAAIAYSELKKVYSEAIKSDIDVQKKKKIYVQTSRIYEQLVKLSKIHINKDTVLLSEAVSDIDKQIRKALEEKQKLEVELLAIKKQMATVQNQERKLRDEISSLVDKEAEVNSKRVLVTEKINKVKDRVAEMMKIKEELRQI